MVDIEALIASLISTDLPWWEGVSDVCGIIAGVIAVVAILVDVWPWIKTDRLRGGLKWSFAFVLIAAIAGQIVATRRVSAIIHEIAAYLNDKAQSAKLLAGEANKLAGAANERAEKLAVEVQLLQGKNDQFERDNQVRQKQLDEDRARVDSSLKKNATSVQAVVSQQRAQDIDLKELRRATSRLKRGMRSVSLIRLNDPVAGQYATNIGNALRKLKPAFTVSFIELPTSRHRGVIVCQNSKDDIKVGKALKDAGIVSSIEKISDEKCTQPIPQTTVPSLFGPVGLPNPKPTGTLIFVGHRRLPADP